MDKNILFELALILVITKSFGLLARRIHLPQVVGALLAGVILGPAVLGLVHQGEIVEGLAEIGVILLMFTAGLETDVKQLRSGLKSSLVIAFIGALVPLGGGFALAYAFGMETLEAIFIGIVLTATSISITVETLQEMGKLKTKAGTTILSVAVIDDILGVIILSFIIGMGGGDEAAFTAADAAWMFAKIFGFFGAAWILGSFMYEFIEYINRNHKRVHRLSIYSLAFCFFMAFLADRFGIADITGAYIAGLSLCSSKAERYVEEKSSVLSCLFFSPIFFVSVGLHASFDGLTSSVLIFIALLLIVAVITKLAGCGLGALLCKFTKKESLQIGCGMVSRGEVAIIIATKGLIAGFIGAAMFSGLIIVVIITTLITPLLLKLSYNENTPEKAR